MPSSLLVADPMFKKCTTILTYQHHKHLLFLTIYTCAHFVYNNLGFYIINILLTFIIEQSY